MNSRESKGFVRQIGVIALVICTLSIGFVSGRLYDGKGLGGSGSNDVIITGDKDKNIPKIDFDLFWNIWDTVADNYVNEENVDVKKMFYGSIKGLVSSLDDPATIFLDPEETESFNSSNEGKMFEGIGAELGYENGQIIVISPISGSPAEKAGIKARDTILKIDGKDIAPSENVFDVVQKIRGKSGSKVVLTVLHKGDLKAQEIEIIRGEITVPSIEIKSSDDSRVRVLKISRFTDSSLSEWEDNWDKAVDSLVKNKTKGIVLDLRGNPGGYFDAAVYAAEDFLPKGTVISKQEDRLGKVKEFKVSRKGRLLNVPVTVLVNAGSASASEILTGALQKNDRAKVIGEKTYGKGTAQSVLPFTDGSSLHLTTLKWLLPDGKWLNRDNPITPNTVVELTDEDFKNGIDPQLEKAVKTVLDEIR
ncbi:MAG: Carboxyl-terminal protease [candidate division WS6 bacterium GW2011_GWF2_39_15]|uniref:Carboxyl-terminal protease n=1 Tax=candidate division WS6 bacterium GW2011_GWF2_39_15 TaxID=1619100 RepID=A0A0G0MQK9_9BACT|nr:MAG: Carboxyl-terminal protease [candidate division WS6 bacterium GW2011_GWF2_39_15]